MFGVLDASKGRSSTKKGALTVFWSMIAALPTRDRMFVVGFRVYGLQVFRLSEKPKPPNPEPEPALKPKIQAIKPLEVD